MVSVIHIFRAQLRLLLTDGLTDSLSLTYSLAHSLNKTHPHSPSVSATYPPTFKASKVIPQIFNGGHSYVRSTSFLQLKEESHSCIQYSRILQKKNCVLIMLISLFHVLLSWCPLHTETIWQHSCASILNHSNAKRQLFGIVW